MFIMTLFADGSDVCFQSGKKPSEMIDPRSGAPKTAMNENAIELERHAIADDPHNYLNARNN